MSNRPHASAVIEDGRSRADTLANTGAPL